ncbi:hypothetical protein BD414DRAFT_481764 [Trametes punicea]|nr:hypothetical protein BD414DRAFT_481764 [Trametes punicea]
MSSRPKPRPRPRPRAPAATTALDTDIPPSSSPGPSSAATSTPPQRSKLPLPAQSTIDEEDALFLRNQSRTAQAWKRINKLAEDKEAKKRKSSDLDSSDSEREPGSSPRTKGRKVKRRTDNQSALPDWTRQRPDELIISSDSEDDILAPKKENKPPTQPEADSPSKANGRRRSRSRSLTPPPALPQYALDRARQALNEVLGDILRAPSPNWDLTDDSVDAVVLDPELASIAERVRAEARRQGSSPVPEGGGPETVKLKVIWKPHPLDPNGRSKIWIMVQRRHHNFYQLCAEIADLAGIRSDSVVLTLDGKRVFPPSTPHSVGIWAEAELEACDSSTYQYLQQNKRLRSESVAPTALSLAAGTPRRSPSCARSPSITELSDSGSGAAESEPEEKTAGHADAFHLVVQSERTKGKNITLRVLPTTKCGTIVRVFLKKAGLEAEYSEGAPAGKVRGRGKAAVAKFPMLSVDGDKMDPETEIGEADLEDGDQVEVVGL